MSNLPNDSDSRELAVLRAAFKRGSADRATAYRLGIYARIIHAVIDDFGAHSKQWIEAFRAGQHLTGISTRASSIL